MNDPQSPPPNGHDPSAPLPVEPPPAEQPYGVVPPPGHQPYRVPEPLRPPPPTQARSIGARLDLAAGEVTISDAGDVKAMSGTPLASGATVSTGKGARALVRTGEGAAIFMRGETKLKLLDRGVDLSAG